VIEPGQKIRNTGPVFKRIEGDAACVPSG